MSAVLAAGLGVARLPGTAPRLLVFDDPEEAAMKHIHYDGSVITTGDDIAEAVVEYAAALGANGRTDTVRVPTFDDHGTATTATILIGPASQIVVDDAEDDALEPEDVGFVDRLREAARDAGAVEVAHADRDRAVSEH